LNVCFQGANDCSESFGQQLCLNFVAFSSKN
jgi:hypothetical protein